MGPLSWLILSIMIITAVSAAGFFFPFLLSKMSQKEYGKDVVMKSPFFLLSKSFSSGIILGVAILHLLADSVEDLGEMVEYPLGLTMAVLGIIIALFIDQVKHYLERQLNQTSPDLDSLEPGSHISATHVHKSPEERKQNYIFKNLMLEGSVAIHTILIGFSFGGLKSIPEIKILCVALSFHQFFEGLSLGSYTSETDFSNYISFLFGFLFFSTFPIGAMLGVFTEATLTGDFTASIANGIAAGLLIYTVLVEMVADEFSPSLLGDKPFLKAHMCICFALGCFSMAILAIWA